MKTVILLAGPSASGKTTLARVLVGRSGYHLRTSDYLRQHSGSELPTALGTYGSAMDGRQPGWLAGLVDQRVERVVVVDAVRSVLQEISVGALPGRVVKVNVTASEAHRQSRLELRGRLGDLTQSDLPNFIFNNPDFVWNSSVVPMNSALSGIGALAGGGGVDVIVGGQYGSEGKGKLAALLAGQYDVLLRSGGPNAGHWVRSESYEYCFHHLPSGSMENRRARVFIAAGATIDPDRFQSEVSEVGVGDRLMVDGGVVLIEEFDRTQERSIVTGLGSTGQGVGSAASRRLMRSPTVRTVANTYSHNLNWPSGNVSQALTDHIARGDRVMLEGTQGSALSLYHGGYPFVTSRDTNVGGLLSECGLSPVHLGDTWLVLRSYPIRVGGNSGPLPMEITWDHVAGYCGVDSATLREREHTSTTKRLRRVGRFDWDQVGRAVNLNIPSRIFLTFADYLDPEAYAVRKWSDLPRVVTEFVYGLEDQFNVPVAGISTGRMQADVVWRGTYGQQ